MKILYFTSTGNNLYISKQIGGELISIPQLVKNNEYEIESDAVGIVFPVFYATSPKILREFIKKVEIKADYIFLICSYGSGGDENALKIMKETLNRKGVKINYTNSVLMVDNFLPIFDMKEEKRIKKSEDIDKQIKKIKEDIELKKDYIFDKKPFTDVPNIEEILETEMSEKFHIEVNNEECNNCKICMKVCPRGNIKINDNKPELGENCEFCLGCVHHCKQHVLNTNYEINKERFINPNIKLSEIIKSNNIT